MSFDILGIDVGSTAVGIVLLDSCGRVKASSYGFHKGQVRATVERMLEEIALEGIVYLACTASTPETIRASRRYDDKVCAFRCASSLHKGLGGLLCVGGQTFWLLIPDRYGKIRWCRSNTSCAAGTGSFLDQQALRLGLSGSGMLGELALRSSERVPLIASRCAVFAKTDLIHAQQSGYSIEEIAGGLCRGLALTIADTLFHEPRPQGEVVFCGGVSLNTSVQAHLEQILGQRLTRDEYSHLYGALGAAYMLLDEAGHAEPVKLARACDIFDQAGQHRDYHHRPLELTLSSYPDFRGIAHYEYGFTYKGFTASVEVDVYEELAGKGNMEVYLGVDIGSTSTKAVIMDKDRRVLAGFYTRTSGRPVDAVRSILAAIGDMAVRWGIEPVFLGAAATGSGRKLIGAIMGADLVLDEITAHARAACEIDPDVDTIIEIGGQDAKFTTLEKGTVTFCAMNTVCAAGTGSFIEEQAQRLSCPLHDYAQRAAGKAAPMASDRCTVFMERDLNDLLSRGYAVDEVLASALHAVCENYLTKVAQVSLVGSRVCFQGATAKNRALVAAFEQRLGRPILVSRYPHLTGAYGAAVVLAEEHRGKTSFRGLGLSRETIDLRNEVCTLCANHCKLTVARVGQTMLASGFLCGRDYDVHSYVERNKSGFDLIRERKRVAGYKGSGKRDGRITIGLPDALHMKEDLEFWRCFFDKLGIATVTADVTRKELERGRNLSGAEFCMPVQHLFAQVQALADRVDHIFLPVSIEDGDEARADESRRQYCYFTQFASSLVAMRLEDRGVPARILTPIVRTRAGHARAKIELARMLRGIASTRSLFDVSRAYDAALRHREKAREAMYDLYRKNFPDHGIAVVLLGRPYTILSPVLNKGIVDIFASLGVRTFFQDMVPAGTPSSPYLGHLLKEVPWKYAADILKVADEAGRTDGLYPVFVTSFRCTPDSFTLECFKRLMQGYKKPYLVLQLDGHDTTAGYETRIEAAVRSFRNHHCRKAGISQDGMPDIIPERHLSRSTVFIPDWDSLSCRLLAANLRREGIDARLLEHSDRSVKEGIRYNTCQCIPISIMAQEYMDSIRRHDLDPSRCALWIPKGEIACNLKVIPHHIKNILASHGRGMERAQVFNGELSMADLSLRASMGVYFSFMFGGMMRRALLRTRPYELESGSTERALDKGMDILEKAFEGAMSKTEALKEVVEIFRKIPVMRTRRPKVAVFGDLYVRDNDFMNQDLVRFLEGQGVEVVTMPYTTYAKMIVGPYLRRWILEGKYLFALSSGAMIATFRAVERRYLDLFRQITHEDEPRFLDDPARILGRFRLCPDHTGESMDNVLKVHYLSKHHPDLSLFILVSPAFCCPGLVTEAMIERIEQTTGIGVVSIVYDGTGGMKNAVVVPSLSSLTRQQKGARECLPDILGNAG